MESSLVITYLFLSFVCGSVFGFCISDLLVNLNIICRVLTKKSFYDNMMDLSLLRYSEMLHEEYLRKQPSDQEAKL